MKKRCAWCGGYAYGTAIDWWWDSYYGWIDEVWPSCGDWYCGEDYYDYYYY